MLSQLMPTTPFLNWSELKNGQKIMRKMKIENHMKNKKANDKRFKAVIEFSNDDESFTEIRQDNIKKIFSQVYRPPIDYEQTKMKPTFDKDYFNE